MPFNIFDPILQSVTWQQNLMECLWEGSTSTAITLISTCDVDQHSKTACISFRATLELHIYVYIYIYIYSFLFSSASLILPKGELH